MTSAPRLSVVIPCYNEVFRLPKALERIRNYLAIQGSFEIVLVDDGSEDGTLAFMQEVELRYVGVRAVALGRNRGKGRAIAEGVRHADGDLVLLTDADLSTPIEELRKLEQAITDGADIAFGSRAVAGARELGQPRYRRVMGRAFNRLVQLLFLSGIHDTQCGFKLCRGPVALNCSRCFRRMVSPSMWRSYGEPG